MVFGVPKGTVVKPSDKSKAERLGFKGDYTRLGNSCWFTNLDHGRRHQPLELMTTSDNMRYSRHKQIAGHEYKRYENYKAIEVPFTDSIPSDYDGVMGVPISFLDKYCPEQFEIIGMGEDNGSGHYGGVWMGGSRSCLVDGKAALKGYLSVKRNNQMSVNGGVGKASERLCRTGGQLPDALSHT